MTPRISAALAGIFLAALGLFARAPQTQPKVANTIEAARQNNLGCAYMNQQLFEKGLKAFQQAVELDPKLAVARLNEAIAFLNLQKVYEAKAALEAALKQDPKNPNAWYNLGLLAKNTGDATAAIDDFKRVTEIDPNDADTWYFLGTAYVQAKQFPQAIEAFQHALQLNPLHASAVFGLSRAYQQSGDVDHAREHLKKFQYITQNKIGAPMSLAYGEQGQYSRAVESAVAVLKAPEQIKVRFADVTKEAGIVGQVAPPPSNVGGFLGSGPCFLDYDNDGHPDIFLSAGGPEGGLGLYHNLGNGKFEDVTRKAGLDPTLLAIGCTTGDYDNDGFVDLVIGFDGRVLLEHNEKNGTFKNATETAGINTNGLVLGLTFLDYDHDGDLDLYITRLSQNHELEVPNTSFTVVGTTAKNVMWRNNGDGTFTDVTAQTGLAGTASAIAAIGSDYNNDRAVDLVVASGKSPTIFENPREGQFKPQHPWSAVVPNLTFGVAALDFDHDGWIDLAFTHSSEPALTLWRNNHGKFEPAQLPASNWIHAWGVAAIDYDNDGWVDLVAVGETKEGKGEVRLFRNLGPEGFKDVTADIGLDKIQLKDPRAIITGDYDGDGATDLLITQNHGPAVLRRNQGGNQNHWLRLALKGLADNKSAIGTKVEVFAGGSRQKFEIAGSNGYLGQNSTDIVVGLGDAKEADVVRMLWPTGVLQDEINVAGDRQQSITEIDRRGSSCPTLFVWNGERYEFVADMLGAGVVGHWVGPGQRDIPRPVEWVKVPRESVREKENPHPSASSGQAFWQHPPQAGHPAEVSPMTDDQRPTHTLSFRFMEPLEEAVYLDQVRLLAVDHPANIDVYPNEYFASNPPYPEFKVVVSKNEDTRPPAGAWGDHGRDLLPDLLAHRYVRVFALTHFLGFAQPHTLTLDLGEDYAGGPLWLLMHGEVEYFSANSMYAASQAGIHAISPYVEAWVANKDDAKGRWKRVMDDR